MADETGPRRIDTGNDYLFLNPKFGLSYELSQVATAYASFAIGNREPSRNDFVDAPSDGFPEHETLRNLEVGYRYKDKLFEWQANYYLMDYRDQLVLTGAVNNVGSNIRTNVARSYRMGIELQGRAKISPKWSVMANATFSRNKIREFEEVISVFANETSIIRNQYEDTDISFSPNLVAGGEVAFTPLANLELAWLSRYVGKQFLDNTGNDSRAIDGYWLNDIRLGYTLNKKVIGLDQVNVYLSAQNLVTITDYSGFDPEVNSFSGNDLRQGVDLAAYPSAKTFTIGLNITL